MPDNVGGRYSVLTVAGVDMDLLLEGAREMAKSIIKNPSDIINLDDATSVMDAKNIIKNPMMQYAWMRNELLTRGYDTEVFASFEPATMYMMKKVLVN